MNFLYFRETAAWIVVLGAIKEFLDPDVDKQADLARASYVSGRNGWGRGLAEQFWESFAYHMSIHRQASALRIHTYSSLVNCDPFREEDCLKKKGHGTQFLILVR